MLWLPVALAVLMLCGRLVNAADPQPPREHPQTLPDPAVDDNTGFKPIFDGRTLQGWDGDTQYWRAENQTLVGETTATHPAKNSTFLVWRGGKPADFELKLEYRISASGNSGVQYRSTEISGPKWVMQGYQADIDGKEWGQLFFDTFARPRGLDLKRVTAQNYDERARTFLALPGQFSYVGDGKTPRVVATLADSATVARTIKDNDWNSLQMIHILNGQVISMVIDQDTANRRLDGEIGLQIHDGAPMKVEFRNIRLKIVQ
jgi:hypothetical protein